MQLLQNRPGCVWPSRGPEHARDVCAIAAGQTLWPISAFGFHIGGREFDDALVKSFILRGLCMQDSL